PCRRRSVDGKCTHTRFEGDRRVTYRGRRYERMLPHAMTWLVEPEQLQLARRRLLDELHPARVRRVRLHRVVADPVESGDLEADVEHEASPAGLRYVDAPMEDVVAVGHQRSAYAARAPLARIELRIIVGHEDRVGRPALRVTARNSVGRRALVVDVGEIEKRLHL